VRKSTFGIELAEEDLFDEQFATIDGMSEIIEERLSHRNCVDGSPPVLELE
jgi:hypothetical protein